MKVCNTTDCEICESRDPQNFKLIEIPCGRMVLTRKDGDRLIFIMKGKLSVKMEECESFFCNQEEIILLTKSNKYEVTALEASKLLVFSLVATYQVCDKVGLKEAKHILDSIHYQFHSLPIKEPMKLMLNSISYYLTDNVLCGYWQKAKQLEFFVVYWNYYTLEDICRFFYPLINKNFEFHAKVIANATKAKTVMELAEICGYSLTTFNKLFKEHFQNSAPYKWMLQQKAPLIKARLLDKTVPIKTIVVEFCFIDQSHLNRYCKRYFSATALQVRNGNC